MTGAQFEDDLNLFTLRRATVVDVFGEPRTDPVDQCVRRRRKCLRLDLRRRPDARAHHGTAALGAGGRVRVFLP